METVTYLAVMVFLLVLNAFFVLAEFASVKIRSTQIQALTERGVARAKVVRYIQTNLDEFLSVCQVGITFASIGLGFVGEPAVANLVKPLVSIFASGEGSEGLSHGIAITISYIFVSFMHIVFGELIPKSVAIRSTEKSALLIAYPMVVFKYIFIVPIWLLNTAVNLFFRLIGYRAKPSDAAHSGDEIRVILEQSQTSGLVSFKRLLFMENILDMGSLTLRNAIQPRRKVQVLYTGASPSEIHEVIAKYRYSRYPLVESGTDNPIGLVHVKDLFMAEHAGKDAYTLRNYVRPCLRAKEDDSLEQVLSTMQRKAIHMAFVYDEKGEWVGIATLEDVIEEVVGTIEEEFPLEQPIHLSEFLSTRRVLIDVEGESIISAVRNALKAIAPGELPAPKDEILFHVIERERIGETYVGHGLALPHARIKNLGKPVVIFIRMKKPIDVTSKKNAEQINYLFLLITPSEIPRIHQIILSHIAGIFESGFLENKLDDNITADEIYKAICTAEETILS